MTVDEQAPRPCSIRVIAVCAFRYDNKILVFEGFDSSRRTYYYRPLGGGVEPGETSREAVAREIREELGEQVENLRLLGTLENLFTCDGRPGHEIVFVYDGRFTNPTIYKHESFQGIETNGEPLIVSWRSIDSFNDHHRLVPEGLHAMLNQIDV